LIVFEGIDGAGKTTQIELLEAHLKELGHKVYRTAEPTESVTGGLLRDALSGVSKRTACEMAALFVLDRIFHNVNPVNGIEKMLADGVDVICDRYYYSSLAYQGSETDFEWVAGMNLNCPEIRRPDCCIFLDLTPEQSLSRISAGRISREIYEDEARLQAVRDKFYHVFDLLRDRDTVRIVSAAGTVEEVAAGIDAALAEVFA
jgi:dTMP kinase